MVKISISILFISSYILFASYGNHTYNLTGNTQEKAKIKVLTESRYSVKKKSGEPKKKDLTYKVIIEYDQNGNQTEIRNGMSGGKYTYTTFKYDGSGNMIENTTYGRGNILIDKNLNEYDEQGNIVEMSSKRPGNNKVTTYCNKYDEDGNLIEIITYEEGVLFRTRKAKFDERGNEIESIEYYPHDILLGKSISRYDDNDNKIEVKSYGSDGELENTNQIKFDERGNQIENEMYDPEGNFLWKMSYRYYDFDAAGNWRRMIMYNNDKPIIITEREIEYY